MNCNAVYAAPIPLLGAHSEKLVGEAAIDRSYVVVHVHGSVAEQVQFSKLYHYVALHTHLVTGTKYRRKCISVAMLGRFRAIAHAGCIGWGGSPGELNGEPNHIDLRIALGANLDLCRFVNHLKTTSSRVLRSEQLEKVDRKPAFASRSSCIISCGRAALSILNTSNSNETQKSNALTIS
jgi:putative transposase